MERPCPIRDDESCLRGELIDLFERAKDERNNGGALADWLVEALAPIVTDPNIDPAFRAGVALSTARM